jgi:hydrogenase maturation protease
MKPLLVLCLGNEVLSDDAFGFKAAEMLKNIEHKLGEDIEITYASLAGFNLLDQLQGRKKVLIVDTIITGKAEPGTMHFFPAEKLVPSRNISGSHEISLPTALKLADLLNIETPQDIHVLAVEAKDVQTLSEELTEPVKSSLPEVIDYVTGWSILSRQEMAAHGN